MQVEKAIDKSKDKVGVVKQTCISTIVGVVANATLIIDMHACCFHGVGGEDGLEEGTLKRAKVIAATIGCNNYYNISCWLLIFCAAELTGLMVCTCTTPSH